VAGRELWLGGSCGWEGAVLEKQLRLRAVHVPPARIAVPVWVVRITFLPAGAAQRSSTLLQPGSSEPVGS
jgi:hypothetical protein